MRLAFVAKNAFARCTRGTEENRSLLRKNDDFKIREMLTRVIVGIFRGATRH